MMKVALRTTKARPFFAAVLWGVITLGACARQPAIGEVNPEGGQIYRPPAASPAPTTVLQTTEAIASTAAPSPPALPACSNELKYIEDLTLPDGTQVIAGSSLDKRWSVENTGSCNWNDRYRLQLIAGPDLGVPAQQMLYPARSGSQATIRIVFTAPNDAGVYRSAWQAYDPTGSPFGDPIFIEIVVAD